MNEEKLPGGQPGGEAPGSPHDVQHSGPPESGQPTPTTRRASRRSGGAPPPAAQEPLYHPPGNRGDCPCPRVLLQQALGGQARRRGSKGSSAPPPAAITVGQSKTGDINIYVNAIGTVTPTYTVTVYSQITGQVMSVHYREGQMVRKGDPLIDIDPRPYEATLTQAQGNLEHDQGVLAEARMDLERYKEALRQKCHRQTAVRGSGAAGRPDRGHGQSRPGHGGLRPGAAGLLPYHRSHQRPGWACAWWTPATRSSPAAAPSSW